MKDLDYRFFPILLLGFLRMANAFSNGLAIPLYYYQAVYNPTLIGFLSAAMTLTYFFSPMLLKNIPDQFGKKKSLIFSVGGTLILQSFFQISLEPLLFFILRAEEGVLLGVF